MSGDNINPNPDTKKIDANDPTKKDGVQDNLPNASDEKIPDKFKKEDGTLDTAKLLGSYTSLEKQFGRTQGEMVGLRSENANLKAIQTVEPKPSTIEKPNTDGKDLIEMTTGDLASLVKTQVKSVMSEQDALRQVGDYLYHIFDTDKLVKELYKDNFEQFDKDVAEVADKEKLFISYPQDTTRAIELAVASLIRTKANSISSSSQPEKPSTDTKNGNYPNPSGAKPEATKSKGMELFQEAQRTGDWTIYLTHIAQHPEDSVKSDYV